ncbi:MAG: glycosyltransferase family 2 protein [Clostridia bacterium]|nr:MAG: glycosyltransferase family 2 protein [Clostridia bacterium]
MGISAVIPAYNEEKTVAAVVRTLQPHPQVTEVIVVNDGSEDGTSGAARRAGAHVVDLPQNLGKGAAIMAGARVAGGEILLLLDADLVGLEPAHIDALLAPVLHGTAEMTVGIFAGGRWLTDVAHRLTPFLSGQRAVRKEMLLAAESLKDSRFGLEVSLSRLLGERGCRPVAVPLYNLSHVMKEEKMGFWRGSRARVRMYWEITRCLARSRGQGAGPG